LKSLDFEIEKSGDGWKVAGNASATARMCQWARACTPRRAGLPEDPQHYYPGVELQTLYE